MVSTRWTAAGTATKAAVGREAPVTRARAPGCGRPDETRVGLAPERGAASARMLRSGRLVVVRGPPAKRAPGMATGSESRRAAPIRQATAGATAEEAAGHPASKACARALARGGSDKPRVGPSSAGGAGSAPVPRSERPVLVLGPRAERAPAVDAGSEIARAAPERGTIAGSATEVARGCLASEARARALARGGSEETRVGLSSARGAGGAPVLRSGRPVLAPGPRAKRAPGMAAGSGSR